MFFFWIVVAPQTLAVGAITLAPLALTVWALWLLAKLASLLGALVIRPLTSLGGGEEGGVFTTILEILTALVILTIVGVLARGAAMAVGSILAVVRPPEARREGDLEQAPLARSVAFAAVGLVAAIWALGSLLT